MLHEILPEVLRLLGDVGCANVTIARGDSNPTDGCSRAWEMRFTPRDKDSWRARLFERRSWLGEHWSRWYVSNENASEIRYGEDHFDIDDVLATDWRFV